MCETRIVSTIEFLFAEAEEKMVWSKPTAIGTCGARRSKETVPKLKQEFSPNKG